MATGEKSLQDLFASLRSTSGSRPHSASQQPAANVSHQPASAPSLDQAADRTASLLSLLKFNQSGQQQQQQLPPQQHRDARGSASRGMSASDLVAFMGKPAVSARDSSAPPPSAEPAASSPTNPQDYLLQLLNRAQFGNGPASAQSPQPVQESSVPTSEEKRPSPEPERRDSPMRMFGSTESRETTPFDPQDLLKLAPRTEATNKTAFTYVNPFEQLAASSPRNASSPSGSGTPQRGATPLSRLHSESNRQDKRQNTASFVRSTHQAHPKSPALDDEAAPKFKAASKHKDRESPAGSPSLLGAPTTDTATVAQALNQVSETVSRQADFALARAEQTNAQAKVRESIDTGVSEVLQDAAIEVKKELGPDARDKLESVLPSSVAGDVKQILDEAAEGNVDGQASADDEKSSANADEEFIVPVYNFAMRPFVSIELVQSEPPKTSFREKAITDIARLKKEFDQIDRTLATASSEYIIYSLPKSGGIRVIRQEDGMDRHIFKESRDHVFSVALSTAPRGKPSSDLQASIATASSGTIYWTALFHHKDNIDAKNIENYCLTFPPVSANEDHTSGGQLKTRAKRSSRHPEYFAVGRGKTIQIVFPLHAAGSAHVSQKNVINTETYFKDRSLKINTGKAGKDFTFSEDDTVLASLDKAGRLRFWDLRELVRASHNDNHPIEPVEIRTPIMTYSTAAPSEKAWPTSVHFVDKLRGYTKGTALRYVIVGMKQNHTLQLWDLGFGKAIQEVHFPHSKESDAICSVCFHPASGIIVVGHPTRNSIYFIHLSAPRYNLPDMTQAKYMNRIASKDSSLPKLESTAIMSGMREYSFASKGQLRSVDLLSVSNDGPVSKESSALFELYVMHSKGVTMLSIDREDLGWSQDMKVINNVNAEDAGIIRVSPIQQPPPTTFSENSSIIDEHASSVHAKAAAADGLSKLSSSLSSSAEKTSRDVEDRAGANGLLPVAEKPERRKKKKTSPSTEESSGGAATTSKSTSYADAVSRPSTTAHTDRAVDDSSKAATNTQQTVPTVAKGTHSDSNSNIAISELLSKELPRIEANVSAEVSRALKSQMDALYKRLNDDRRVVEAQHGANQEAILRMVSKSLGENVESSLKNIVSESIQKDVIPAIRSYTISAVQEEVLAEMSKTVANTVKEQLKQGLTEATSQALNDSNFLQANSAHISASVTSQLTSELRALADKITGSRANASNVEATEQLHAASEARMNRLLIEISSQRQTDAIKMDQLAHMVRGLSQVVSAMEATQRQLREEVVGLKPQQGSATENRTAEPSSPARAKENVSQRNVEQSPAAAELRRIVEAMNSGEYEDAMVKWLQSQHQAAFFDDYFVKVDPRYLQHCSPLVTLSVAAAVTASLQTNLPPRLMWLETVLDSIDLADPDIREVAPKIMNVICQRLETYYMELSERNSRDPSLKRIPPLTRKARDMCSVLQSRA